MKLTKHISHKTTFRALCVAGTLLVGCEGGGDDGDGGLDTSKEGLPVLDVTYCRGIADNHGYPLGACYKGIIYKDAVSENRTLIAGTPIGLCSIHNK